MKVFTFCLLLCVLFFTACQPSATPVSISNRPVSINGIPQTNLPLLNNVENLGWESFDGGKRQKLSELKGKIVVLDFWATYCPPCLDEIPHLVELQRKHGGLQIIGLHVGGAEDRPKVPAFAEKLKINYPLATPDEELNTALLGSDFSLPQTLVFDREGKLLKKFVGFDENIKADLDRIILQAVGENE